MSHLGDGLEFGIVKGIRAGVRVDIEGVDAGFLAGVQRGGAVRRVRNEAWQGTLLGSAIDAWTPSTRVTPYCPRCASSGDPEPPSRPIAKVKCILR